MGDETNFEVDHDPFVQPMNSGRPVTVIDNGDEEYDFVDHNGHPRLEAVERLCFSYNTIGNTCYVSDKNLKFTSDFTYTTSLSLQFDSTTIRCQTIKYLPCTVKFVLTTPNSSL